MRSETILLQGERYNLGIDFAITIGKTNQNQLVIVKSIICKSLNNELYIRTGDSLMKLTKERLIGYYRDTPMNRYILNRAISDRKTKNRWLNRRS